MKIKYRLTTDGCYSRYVSNIENLIRTKPIKRICEIGGGANPLLPIDFVKEHDLTYTVLDISETELEKAPSGFF